MAQTAITKEQFWGELEHLGEVEVRVRLATGRYGNSQGNDAKRLVLEWLHRQSLQRAESRRCAGPKTDASEDNATSCSNRAARVAVALAMASILISLAAFYFSLR
jgi:hypothetical protein